MANKIKANIPKSKITKTKKPKKVALEKVKKLKEAKPSIKIYKGKKPKSVSLNKKDREQLNKINQLKRSLKAGKDFHYGKRKFKSKEAAERYLQDRLIGRKLKGDKSAKENYKLLKDINKKLQQKATSEEIKNLKSLFPDGIKLNPNATPKQIKRYIQELLIKSRSLSYHELFARLQAVCSQIGGLDGYKIAKSLYELPMDSIDLRRIEELIDELYMIAAYSPEPYTEALEAIDLFLDYYITKYPDTEENYEAYAILKDITSAKMADFE